MRWAEQQRMEWIAKRSEPFRRKDLMEAFLISVPQASNDIQKFLKLHPGIWKYNTRKRYYERIET